MKTNKKLEQIIQVMIEDTYDYWCVHKPGISLEAAIEDAVQRGYQYGKTGKMPKRKAF